MPTSEAPADVNEPNKPPARREPADSQRQVLSRRALSWLEEPAKLRRRWLRGSRWVDYDTHELLEMISELEDERRWARLREGAFWAILVHLAILLALFLLPKYIFVPHGGGQNREAGQGRVHVHGHAAVPAQGRSQSPLIKPPQIDKQTMEEMRKQSAQRRPGRRLRPETKPRGAGAGSAAARAADSAEPASAG